MSRSVKGDREPQHHPLVLEFFRTGFEPEYRERGYERCSEAAALSDALYAEDARRRSVDDPVLTIDEPNRPVRRRWHGDLSRARVGRLVAGTSGPPCLSCAMLLRHFGLVLKPPGFGVVEGD